MLKVPETTISKIHLLYRRFYNAQVNKGFPGVSEFIEFVKLRDSILTLTFDREAEFSILELLVKQARGETIMHTPRDFLFSDVSPINARTIDARFSKLLESMGLKTSRSILKLSDLKNNIDKFLPANTPAQIEIGLEALQCFALLTTGKHHSKHFGGPSQDGQLHEGYRFYGLNHDDPVAHTPLE